MYRLILAAAFLAFTACNSKAPTSQNAASENAAKGKVSHSWTREDEMEFLDACVEGSAERLGEEKAFNHCKCVLRQMQAANPSNDSAKAALIITDSTRMAAMLSKCE